mmetsp:Transcript_10755/g.38192  ORF Transcript_10755/g.38192 Transcript_10755/m.38192 type:complete len:215 (+) Transcript_10755:1481-2125(+)
MPSVAAGRRTKLSLGRRGGGGRRRRRSSRASGAPFARRSSPPGTSSSNTSSRRDTRRSSDEIILFLLLHCPNLVSRSVDVVAVLELEHRSWGRGWWCYRHLSARLASEGERGHELGVVEGPGQHRPWGLDGAVFLLRHLDRAPLPAGRGRVPPLLEPCEEERTKETESESRRTARRRRLTSKVAHCWAQASLGLISSHTILTKKVYSGRSWGLI